MSESKQSLNVQLFLTCIALRATTNAPKDNWYLFQSVRALWAVANESIIKQNHQDYTQMKIILLLHVPSNGWQATMSIPGYQQADRLGELDEILKALPIHLQDLIDVSPLSGFYSFHNFVQWFKESCADLNPFFPTGRIGGVSSTIVLSKNERFAAYTQTNFQGLQAPLEPGKWYESPEAMNFPNDRMQSLRKE
ncbi:hypothetical protein pdam_00000971 [Pocillopora damicornis]|uniref:Beta/gamma crystallin 'Greek key' domain-containing protein n=1 Tax=Pocillopora damicornis TaxID=46731 RepID=A0A3M6T6D6_POCDA|nr:hypothetical protein pdam_00000971 [Pocillopora damicornis]